jgi:hypothetical protein
MECRSPGDSWGAVDVRGWEAYRLDTGWPAPHRHPTPRACPCGSGTLRVGLASGPHSLRVGWLQRPSSFVEVQVPVMFAGGELAVWIPGGLRPTGIPLRGLARVTQAGFGWRSLRGHTRSEWDGFRGHRRSLASGAVDVRRRGARRLDNGWPVPHRHPAPRACPCASGRLWVAIASGCDRFGPHSLRVAMTSESARVSPASRLSGSDWCRYTDLPRW